MRIGTWNLALRWSEQHRQLLLRQKCDVWLLTEVSPRALQPRNMIAEFRCHLSTQVMDRKQHWAAVLSREAMIPIPDPHPASAAASIKGITYCSTILPWRGAPSKHPWVGDNHSGRTESTLAALLKQLPKSSLVWGQSYSAVGYRAIWVVVEGYYPSTCF